MKIEFDLNRPVEWQFHPAALDKGSNFWRSTAVLHRDTGLSFVFPNYDDEGEDEDEDGDEDEDEDENEDEDEDEDEDKDEDKDEDGDEEDVGDDDESWWWWWLLIILRWKLSNHESYLVMKVRIVKEVMTRDVSHVAMFFSGVH